MKLSIIDHMVNPGGGSRVLRNLLPAIRILRPDWGITLYANHSALRREGLDKEFITCGIKIRSLRSVQLANTRLFSGIKGAKTIITFLQNRYQKLLRWFPLYFSGAIHREIEHIAARSDLVFCSWPYMVKCPKIATPMVAIFHDFNFRYCFNGAGLHPTHLESLFQEIPRWLDACTPVVSTHFMQRELEKFYPAHRGRAKVVHLSSLGAEDISARGMNLPSYPDLTAQEISYICEKIKSFYSSSAAADMREASLMHS